MVEILIIAVCLFINAVLSCIEMAFITVSKPHIRQLAASGSKAAMRILILKRNPERALSVLQIGITLVAAISAAVGGATAAELLSDYFIRWFAVSAHVADLLSVAAIVLPLTYISMVIGELVPKSLALRFPLRFALAGGSILVVLDRILSPFVFILDWSTKFFTKILFAGIRAEKNFDSSREVDLDPLTDAHKQYVFNLIDITKKTVRDILIPWDQVFTVDYAEHYYVILERIKTSRHTRLPVLKEGKVVGILHTKEFVSETEVSKIDWTELVRSILIVGPNEPILNALKKFQNSRSHMAMVMQGEEPLGMVTVEDIVEEIVGEIYDEDDDPKTLLSANSRIRVMNLRKDPAPLKK